VANHGDPGASFVGGQGQVQSTKREKTEMEIAWSIIAEKAKGKKGTGGGEIGTDEIPAKKAEMERFLPNPFIPI